MPRTPGLESAAGHRISDAPGDWTISRLGAELRTGRMTSSELTELALSRALDPGGGGARTFVTLNEKQARTAAAAQDALRSAPFENSPIVGLPGSIKDNFDIEGQ